MASKVYYGKNVKLSFQAMGVSSMERSGLWNCALSGTAAEVASHGSGCLTEKGEGAMFIRRRIGRVGVAAGG